ncbi:MAG: trypsin-like serine peptidase [Candidatus Methylumidiphilus sp.]
MNVRRLMHGILALTCCLAAPPATADPQTRSALPGIIGHDDRAPLDTAAWPWQALGRVNQASGAHCTGALIAADAVLTAAHCLMDRHSGLWLEAEDLVFVAGHRRDADQGYARGRHIVHAEDAIDPRRPTLQDIAHDWAILYLQHPLAIRPIPVRPLPPESQPDLRLMRAGYSQDRPHLLSLHNNCALLARIDGDRVLSTDCDGTFGDSGSPLLVKHGKAVWIVGITSAVVTRGTPLGSYAVHASAFAAQIPAAKPQSLACHAHSSRC